MIAVLTSRGYHISLNVPDCERAQVLRYACRIPSKHEPFIDRCTHCIHFIVLRAR